MFKWYRDFMQNTDVAADYRGEYSAIVQRSPDDHAAASTNLNIEYRQKGMSEKEMSEVRARAFER